MSQATAILGLVTETPLHAGTGRITGVIDLPIQRERHTGWPCVYGSAVKGALRTKAEDTGAAWVFDVFGPPTGDASAHGGALAVGDARLLLLPIRSLTTHFRWVTSPDLLARYRSDCRRLAIPCDFELEPPSRTQALVAAESGGSLFLEEFRFEESVANLDGVVAAIGRLVSDGATRDRLKDQLAVVHDDLFAHLATHCTPVAAHVAIESETKTVTPGALWYEETLPPSTVLYTNLVAGQSRRQGSELDERAILSRITGELFPSDAPYLQLGGNETVGMGWCRVATVEPEGA